MRKVMILPFAVDINGAVSQMTDGSILDKSLVEAGAYILEAANVYGGNITDIYRSNTLDI